MSRSRRVLDQSFSVENFRRIFDLENRKGVYLEKIFFPNVRDISNDIKSINIQLRSKYKNKALYATDIQTLEDNKKVLKLRKEELLLNDLQEISDNTISKAFRVELTQTSTIGGKALYSVGKSAESFFAMKQIQKNIYSLYKVKQANRFEIVSQLKLLLGDGFIKHVLRTDVDSFYESIPHQKLKQKIDDDNLLSPLSKRMVRQVLQQYGLLTGLDKGIPRGVGISAYLAELYMRDVDRSIKSIGGITYYARYVDDIVILLTPSYKSQSISLLDSVKKIIEDEFGLTINMAKTNSFNLTQNNPSEMQYLGYKFFFGEKATETRLTTSKVERYKQRIRLALEAYSNLKKVNEKKARQILVKRIRFLTGNTRLANNKSNILVGIYYSNSQLTNTLDLKSLDIYLKHLIRVKVPLPKLQKRLRKYSFLKGFKDRRYSPFKPSELSEITDIWKKVF